MSPSTAPQPVAPAPIAVAPTTRTIRIRVFVDYWNLQLCMNEREAHHNRTTEEKFRIDWNKLPAVLIAEAAALMGLQSHSYEGMAVYSSFDPSSADGGSYRKWLLTWLDRQPGVQVTCFERRRKHAPKCRRCHRTITNCPHADCNERMEGTVEKGVDTAIATDMIRLAWEQAYDVAILSCSDADLVPAVSFLDLRGFKIINAGFPPKGTELSRACWATIDVFKVREQLRRQ